MTTHNPFVNNPCVACKLGACATIECKVLWDKGLIQTWHLTFIFCVLFVIKGASSVCMCL